jgi:mono/diheme cytochrome c family protein
MPPRKLAAIFFVLCAIAGSAASQSQPVKKLTIALTRHAGDDLEVTGMVAGLPAGTVGYVSYAELVALPQITTTIQNDSNFADQPSRGVRITGIRLEQLAKALGALPGSDLIVALCTDRYRSHYPADYIAAHHPIFALKINGERPTQWAAKRHEYDPGPYFITHANFIPRDKFLTYLEQPQIPDNIMRLNFSTVAATYGPITPRGDFPPNSPVAQGFLIAKQNCLRCHFLNDVGGTKSGRDWPSLATWAREQPQFFERYVYDPQSVEPHAHMEGSPTYDDATLNALTAYFRTFTEEKPHK